MIITRSPLRISLGGGGTDLPSYYRQHGGFVIGGAIDKYVYITLHQTFDQELIIKYSRMERVRSANEVQHPIIREALKLMLEGPPHLEITSMADIPAGTGLGSSGSFTAALLKALHIIKKNPIQPGDLAEQACHIEIDLLGKPIGKQDQYIAAYGGLISLEFMPDGRVHAAPLRLDADTRHTLEDNLLLFFTGYSRSATGILQDQDDRTRANDPAMVNELHVVKELGLKSKEALESADLVRFAELMNEHWERKRQRSDRMSNDRIDEWYELARRNGAIGGKLIGAGGGGFLMFYAEEDKRALRRAMAQAGLHEVRFRFDFEGTKLIAES
jgi:D-glycero-alpha-D-manno-heptose-7-phosphate kinase